MYTYIENKYFIPLDEIVTIVDYEHFSQTKNGEEYLKYNRKKIIDLSKKEKRTLIITDKYIYLSSYTVRTLYSRGEEFKKIKEDNKYGGKNE
ncbi:MAG: extracellular matrix regulator RemB [Fusobacteriota bacterium]